MDRLIRELIATGRPATTHEIERIRERMATAPFDPRPRPVPTVLRGQVVAGRRLEALAPSLIVHLAQRVLLDAQWGEETTPEAYLEELRRAVRSEQARLVIYEARGGNVAAAFADNEVPEERLGANAEPFIWVVYSADRGMLITGYQVSGLETVRLGEKVRWLR